MTRNDFVSYQIDGLSAAEGKLRNQSSNLDRSELIGYQTIFEPRTQSCFQTETLDLNIFKDILGTIWELKHGKELGSMIEYWLGKLAGR